MRLASIYQRTLDSYASQLNRLRVTTHAKLNEAIEAKPPQRVNLAGSVTAKGTGITAWRSLAFIQLSDQTGVSELHFLLMC